MPKVLIVDDDPEHCRSTCAIVGAAGYDLIVASGGAQALDRLARSDDIAAMVLDLVMPEIDGMAVLEALRRDGRTLPVIVQTRPAAPESAMSALRLGAVDFVTKPICAERLTVSLGNALRLGALETCLRVDRHKRERTLGFADLDLRGEAMARVLALGRKAAASTIPVLLEGEAGTGKKTLARAIHGSSERSGKPFVAFDCGALAPDRVEATLFGHVRGAIAGAAASAPGRIREAHNGTLFLDRIGDLPQEAQVRLLGVLQEGMVEPVGGGRPVKVNVRVISATDRRLLNLARDGSFREDLYYRLHVLPIYVPPLRERREDIAGLLDHFAARFSAEEGRRVSGAAPETLELLSAYDWPGNIRQFENAVFRAVALSEGPLLAPDDFPRIVAALEGKAQAHRLSRSRPVPDAPIHIDQARPAPRPAEHRRSAPAADRFVASDGAINTLQDVERQLIVFAMDRHAGRMAQVARALGIGRSTLYRKLKEYGLDAEPGRHAA